MNFERVKGWWPWVLVLGALGFAHGPALARHGARSFDATILNDDARQQIYPFFRYADSSLLPHDYIADYYLNCFPVGFRALYTLSAPLIDPAVSSKIAMYLMLLITVAGLGVAANRLGGKVAAWAAMSLSLGADLYLDRMGGGLPRAFGFPILAWALVALTYGRTKWLAALVWLGACFYPVAGVAVGLALAFFLLLLPEADRGDSHDWDLRRRLRFLAIVAGVSFVLLLPAITTSSKYAPTITSDDITEYPEAGPGGRYGPESRAPFGSFFANASLAAVRGLAGAGRPLAESVFEWVNADQPNSSQWTRLHGVLGVAAIFTLAGWLSFIASSSAARRVMMLAIAALTGFSIASLVAPYFYLPTRYTEYSMPLLAVLMVTTSVAGLFSVRQKLGWAGDQGVSRTGATLAFCLFVLATIGGRGSHRAGLYVETHNAPLYEAIAGLPVDTVVAGWPSTAIENVPYVARRAAFLTYETHQVFHQQYADVMRDRMQALIDATFATSNDPLIQLRDRHGVTHMLVYLPQLRSRTFEYFEPFDRWIEQASRASAGKTLSLQELVDNHAIYRDGGYALIDLGGLPGPI